jgi:hypothetical protein
LANEENLIPMDERSQNEARELGKKGGKKSGEARRRKKDMKAKMKLLLSLQPTASQTELLKALGIPEEDADNEMLLLVAMFQAATEDRDNKAFDKVMDVLGKTVQREELALKKKQFAQQNGQKSVAELPQLLQALQEDDAE